MLVRAGFGRLEVSNWVGSWVPFRISISNQGPPISARLIVHCESSPNPNPQVREYVKEVQLATGSRQLHEIAAFLNSGERPIVRIQADDQVITEAPVNIERSYGLSDQLEIAVVDTDSTALNNISSAEIIRAPNRAPFNGVSRGVPAQAPSSDPSTPVPPRPSFAQRPEGRRGSRSEAPRYGKEG